MVFASVFVGCAKETIYKDVYIPVKCQIELESKPAFDGSFESAKELMSYFLRTEKKLKICVGE
ncbi:hypothetical protein CSG_5910 [Campylobacter fetus subsp. venerealis str. 84-112]|uniref:Uncharacterized protein n=2 Tax=Campylobacter fetus TaxID=196 RepID=A0AAE6M9J7_CAMFE|nr:hypothetical protein CFV97608_0479 [Campylobacter fetus subsp. venerealis 97/608]EGU23666.1 Hypothetical protein CFV354_0582 [Campylobacter fetus subsp. venerealis NCTC 10354]QEL44459.1 hypothetical protein CFVT_0479 [Campylobacter fetus subsp. venerealis NCTC 10354]CDF64511.1 hypothetical protein CSG_5910 [Campylobacter fetus subsp. venerealis str. 84-112]